MSLVTDSSKYNQYIRKVKCARHYVLKPGGQPFVMERIPALKNIKECDARRLGIKLWKKKKDRFGRAMQNFKDYIQPPISAALARETYYLPTNPICNQCRRCVIS